MPKPSRWKAFRSLPGPMRGGAYLALWILLLLTLPAQADAIAKHGNDWVRITALGCKNEAVRKQIEALGRDPLDFRAAAHFGGKDWAACWIPRGQAIHLIYEDGDQGLIPIGDLKPAPEA